MNFELTALQRQDMPNCRPQLMWQLLSFIAQRFSGCESCSIPFQTADRLLNSICFSVKKGMGGSRAEITLFEDLKQIFYDGQKAIEKDMALGKRLLSSALCHGEKLENEEYHHATDEIKDFFSKYDPFFFSAEIPCLLCYPFDEPVSEQLWGIDYINEYLVRLLKEGELEQYIPENAPVSTITEQTHLSSEELHRVIEEFLSCPDEKQKLDIVKQSISGIADMTELLNACCDEADITLLLSQMSDSELLLLLTAAKEQAEARYYTTEWQQAVLQFCQKRGII